MKLTAMKVKVMSAAGLAAAVWLMAGVPSMVHAQEATEMTAEVNKTVDANYKEIKTKYKEMLNFKDCLDFKMKPCVWWCPTPLGPKPAPGIELTYREPVAVIAVKYHQGAKALDSSSGLFSGVVLTAGGKKEDQASATNRQRTWGMQQRSNFDSVLYDSASPGARIRSSATPVQATQSLTCGVLGIIGLFVNPLAASVVNNLPIGVQPISIPGTGVPVGGSGGSSGGGTGGGTGGGSGGGSGGSGGGANPTGSSHVEQLENTQMSFVPNYSPQIVEKNLSNKRFAQSQEGGDETDVEGDIERGLEEATYQANMSTIPLVESNGDQMYAVGGLQLTGSTQKFGMSMAVQAEATIQLMNDTASESQNLAKLSIESENASRLCASRGVLFESLQYSYALVSSTIAKKTVNLAVFPAGSYLGSDYQQEVDDSRPIQSCPMNHAGVIFIPNLGTSKGFSEKMVNCHEVCKKKPTGDEDCRMVPLPGYGGHCATNALSQISFGGYYPACNGLSPEWVADKDGDMQRNKPEYNPENDHRRRLNAWLERGQSDAMLGSTIFVATALNNVNAKILALGGKCDESNTPIGTWGKELKEDEAIGFKMEHPMEWYRKDQSYRIKSFAQSSATNTGGANPSGVTGFNLTNIKVLDLGSTLGALPVIGPAVNMVQTWTSMAQSMNVLSTFTNAGFPGLDSLTGGLSSALSSITGPISSALSSVTSSISGALNSVTSTINSFTAPITQALNSITSSISTAMNAITGPITQALNSIMAPINSAISSITGSISSAFGSLGLPGGIGFDTVFGAMNVLNNAIGGVSELMRSGGATQMAKGIVTCTVDVTGLCPVWRSENAKPQWFTPPLDIRNAIMPLITTVGGIPCNGSQLIKDLGTLAGGTGSIGGISLPENPFCDGWGTKIPSVGVAYNKEEPVAAANIFGKTLRIGQNMFLIASDRSGQGMMFSYEYPQINRGGGTTETAVGTGTSNHKSSKCYGVGSHDPRWRTKGESLIPNLANLVPTDLTQLAPGKVANANEGYHVFSGWKHTKCCIPILCPFNVKRSY